MVDAEDVLNSVMKILGSVNTFSLQPKFTIILETLNLPPLDEEQFDKVLEYLAELCLGSPAICYLKITIKIL